MIVAEEALNIVNPYFEFYGDGWDTSEYGEGWSTTGVDTDLYPFLHRRLYLGFNRNVSASQEIILPEFTESIKLNLYSVANSQSWLHLVGVRGIEIKFFDESSILLDENVQEESTNFSHITEKETFDFEVPPGTYKIRLKIFTRKRDGNALYMGLGGIDGTVTINRPLTDFDKKFTPYGLTALPPLSGRDPNGVYFIRTSTGFKIVTISKTTLEPVFLDMVTYTVGNPTDINSLKTGDACVWTPQGLKESMFNLFTCQLVMTPVFDAAELVMTHLKTSLIVTAGNGADISIPDASVVEGHIVRIVSGKAGGLYGNSIDQPYKYFDGSTIQGSSLAGDYMVLQSDGNHWYMIGG